MLFWNFHFCISIFAFARNFYIFQATFPVASVQDPWDKIGEPEDINIDVSQSRVTVRNADQQLSIALLGKKKTMTMTKTKTKTKPEDIKINVNQSRITVPNADK